MANVFLGLGSNMGNRKENIDTAINELKLNGITIIKQSHVIETNPIGGPPQAQFLNAVIKCKTDILPQELLQKIKSIEKKLGRVKTVDNGPRVIDIDILFYDRRNIVSKDLIIPHPRIKERDFVLRPLKEIEPNLVKEFLSADY